MKNYALLFLLFFSPFYIYSQNVEVLGGLIADSLDVQSGPIKNVADPVSTQDAATKAYVDLLEVKVNLLEATLDSLLIALTPLQLTVQGRLDSGETPFQIYNSDNNLLDSLYGKIYQAGLIAYLDTISGTGFVSSISDLGSTQWGCLNVDVGNTSGLIGWGQINTTNIVSNSCSTVGTAANLCYNLNVNNYNDWFLPSTDELNLLYTNLHLNGNGGFAGIYWTSTAFIEFTTDDLAWVQNFSNGNSQWFLRTDNHNVRAIREF